MLKYLIAVTESTAVLAILLGFLYGYISGSFGSRGRRILTAGCALGLIISAVYAVLRNTTKIIDKSGGNNMWIVRIFAVSLAALILFLLLHLPALRKRIGGVAIPCAGALLALTYIFYAMPPVFAYPGNFNIGKESYLSTAFIYRFIGYLLGLALAIVIMVALIQVCRRMKRGHVFGAMVAVLLINAFTQVANQLGTLYSKRYISGHSLFTFIRFTSNHSNLFVYLILAVTFTIPVALWLASLNVREPYNNPAEHRRIRAKWRSIRRWSSAVAVCFVCVVLILTVIKQAENREITLSPVEECEIGETACYVPLTQVSDGHLHRFAYTSENGVAIRFIIIQKPGGTAYGIGMDACDICGETGYFERNGQIVCKLCDVVMNVNTIGFKGGCNPKVINGWSIENGNIVVPIESLLAYEKDFK